jgi:hypothetical protein
MVTLFNKEYGMDNDAKLGNILNPTLKIVGDNELFLNM